jgi:hypothetical protein
VVVNEPEVVGSPRQSTPQETEARTEVFEVWLNTNLPEDDDRFRYAYLRWCVCGGVYACAPL